MKLPTRDELTDILKQRRISKRLSVNLRYVPEEITSADLRVFLAVLDKAGNEGILLYGDTIVPIQVAKRTANSRGRTEAIICDICATWRRGTASAVLTIRHSSTHTSSYLVCADLDCSLHVRDLTEASKLSRTQLRESITSEARVARLESRLNSILNV